MKGGKVFLVVAVAIGITFGTGAVGLRRAEGVEPVNVRRLSELDIPGFLQKSEQN